MKALLQRVSRASVDVDGECIGEISRGLLVFVGVEKGDDEDKAQRLAKRLVSYRVFCDADNKMNLNVQQVNGGVLVISQFTLAADTHKGNRPGFSTAAPPAEGEVLYNYFVEKVRELIPLLSTGRFGADMQVSLLNDGPVTFLLSV